LSAGFRKIKASCARSGTRLWIVNQVRTTFVSTPTGSIAKLEPGGGFALRFAANHRYQVSWVHKDKDDGKVPMLRVRAEKVKYGPSNGIVEIPCKDGLIDPYMDLIMAAERYGVVIKKGSWYEFDGSLIGQGLRAAAAAVEEHKELYDKIYEQTVAKACPEVTVP
jgi:recombination protein RecA